MQPVIHALKAGDLLVPFHDVKEVNISRVEYAEVTITTHTGYIYVARGFDAIEAVMAMKPSALEGRRLRWQQGAWAFHNLVAHPVVQILAWMGLKRRAVWFHDVTTPKPRDFR